MSAGNLRVHRVVDLGFTFNPHTHSCYSSLGQHHGRGKIWEEDQTLKTEKDEEKTEMSF